MSRLVPCYISPEKVQSLALQEAKCLESCSDTDWVEPSSVLLGRDGHFVHSIFESPSLGHSLQRRYIQIIDLLSGRTPLTAAAHRRMQLFIALEGYAQFWSEQGSIMDEFGRAVPREQRRVLNSNFVEPDSGIFNDARSFNLFLKDLKVVPVVDRHVHRHRVIDQANKRWRERWTEEARQGRVYSSNQQAIH